MSKRIITDANIMRVVNNAIKSGGWTLENGTKHPRIVHTSGRMVAVTTSASDHRSHKNLEKHIRHVEKGLPGWGQGNIIG